MKTAYLGLGTNLGERLSNLSAALWELAADPAIKVMRGSSVYETKPVGLLDQPDFLNMVVAVETTHSPGVLLDYCLWIETRLGRERRERWGPRLIDLDVLLYDDLVFQNDRLVLPHPRMLERSFVLTPLAEISPELTLNGTAVCELAAGLGEAGLRPIASWEEFAEDAGFL